MSIALSPGFPLLGTKRKKEGEAFISSYLDGVEIRQKLPGFSALLKMVRYYSTTMCHYWEMSVK